MFNNVQSTDPAHKFRALTLFGATAHSIAPHVTSYLGTVYTVIESALKEQNSELKLAAFNALVALVGALSDSKERLKFQQLVPLMIDSLGSALTSGDEATAQEALSSFVELVESDPKFVRNHLSHVASSMLQIVESESLTDETRTMAVEFLITLVEARDKAPGMMRKLPDFGTRFFKALLDCMLHIDDDEDWYDANSEQNNDAGESDLFECGQMNLDRLALALGSKFTLQHASSLLPQYLQSEDWRCRHAGLMAISQIAEGCAKGMSQQLDETISPCLNLIRDSHPRVRHAALNCLGQLSTDLNGELQSRAFDRALPAMLHALDDDCARVRAHAAGSVVNFSNEAEQEHLQQYLDSMVSKLLSLLQSNNPRLVLESACSGISSIAQTAKAEFTKYYDTIMPLLKQLVEQAQGKELQNLRARAIECISLIGMSVGKERFQSDARGVMDMLLVLQQSASGEDDALGMYAMQACTRICSALGKDFLPYVDVVMPKVLQEAKKEDVTIAQSQQEAENSNDDDLVQALTNDGKVVQLRTSLLEEKHTAVSMIACYLEELEEHLFPYLEDISNILLGEGGLLTYTWHEGVRETTADALPHLAESALAASRAGKCSAEWAGSYCTQYVLPRLLSASEEEQEYEVLSSMLEAMGELVQRCPERLDAQTLDRLAEKGLRTVDEARANRKDKHQRANDEDFTEEDAELLEDERESEEQVLEGVIELLTSFAKAYKSESLPLYERHFQRLAPLAQEQNHADDRRVALSTFVDVLRLCGSGQSVLALLQLAFPQLLSAARSSDTSLRQCAVYGLGTASEGVGGEAFRPYAQQAVQVLLEVVSTSDARDSNNASATDNAVSSLLRLLTHELRQNVPQQQVAQAIVQRLPLRTDEEEAQFVHKAVAVMTSSGDTTLLGQQLENLPAVLQALAEVATKPKLIGEEGIGIVKQAFKAVKASPQMVQKLTPEQQQAFGSIG
jgi:hypothetical protein